MLVLVWLGYDRAWPLTMHLSGNSAEEREREGVMEIFGCETIVELEMHGWMRAGRVRRAAVERLGRDALIGVMVTEER